MLQSAFVRATAILTVAMLATLTFSAPLFATSAEVTEASHRVNIAGRQRVLSQRMSKAACFAHAGIDVEIHRAMQNDAFALFTASHKALQYGDVGAGLGAEKIPAAVEALRLVDARWAEFSLQIQKIAMEKQRDRDQISALDAAGLLLLRDMNDVVHTIASGYGDLLDDLPMINSITIDVAGRQRMLTQKAAKEFCLIDYGIDVEANRARLAETIALFSDTLDALINGVPGMVIAPPNDAVLAKLHEVEAEWAVPYAVFLYASKEGPQTCCGHRWIVIEQVEKVLVLMNQAVGMYETAQ